MCVYVHVCACLGACLHQVAPMALAEVSRRKRQHFVGETNDTLW